MSFAGFDFGKSPKPDIVAVDNNNANTKIATISSPEQWDSNWDYRTPNLEAKSANSDKNGKTSEGDSKPEKPKASRYIYLIRHGQSVESDDRSKQHLTDVGKQQAIAAGKLLKANPNQKYTAIVQSGLLRAQETAQLIAQELGSAEKPLSILTDPLLNEGYPVPESPPSAQENLEYRYFKHGARAEAAFRRYFHRAKPSQTEDSHEILVGHANSLRFLACRALQIPPEGYNRMELAHGSISQLVIRPSGNVGSYKIGSTGHLPPEMITGLGVL